MSNLLKSVQKHDDKNLTTKRDSDVCLVSGLWSRYFVVKRPRMSKRYHDLGKTAANECAGSATRAI